MMMQKPREKRGDTFIQTDRAFHFARTIVGGLPVAVLDRRATAELMVKAALARRGTGQRCLFFTSANGQVISLCASEPDVKQLFEEADLISADGMSLVLASRLRTGLTLPERVATSDGFHDTARIAAAAGASFYFLGATEDVNARAVERASELYPALAIVGRRNGYFQPEDESKIVDCINAARPDILWVGLGVPHQQQFIVRNRGRLRSVGVAKSCGGLFDFVAERNKRAPQWMQDAGLEWAFRIQQEPGRLAWRYLTTSPHAAYCFLRATGDVDQGVINHMP
jgi:exopolysaccharide biosynthesis WecB/TagA/CpsF family protein